MAGRMLLRGLGGAAFAWLFLRAAAGQEEPPLPAGLESRAPARSAGKAAGEGEPELPLGLAPPGEAGAGEEPALPARVGGEAGEPELPAGLEAPPEEPEAPTGLGEDAAGAGEEEEPAERGWPALPFSLHGFWEARGGLRTQRDPNERDASLGETRLQLEAERHFERLSLKLAADFLADAVERRHRIFLEEGQGFVDLREAYAGFSPLSFTDIKAGRQVLTWGVGDLVFINDLFPKDWNSFFIGRDEEYLKAPSDAVRLSLFGGLASAEAVYTPRFDADRFIDGRRVSFFNSDLGRRSGRDAVVRASPPDDWFSDDEWAGRIYRNLGGYELAAYGYLGFWKSPAGMDPASGRATFPELNVYGASARGPVFSGIGSLELGYYDSLEDRGGDDPFVPNSQLRFLAGYERELVPDLTAGMQYYLEWMLEHGAYERSLPAGIPEADEVRHVLTWRFTWLTLGQDLEWSLFAFYSPSDTDAYLRPRVKYKVTDAWSVEAGANVFAGERQHTFFGQFSRNTNVTLGLRYSF